MKYMLQFCLIYLLISQSLLCGENIFKSEVAENFVEIQDSNSTNKNDIYTKIELKEIKKNFFLHTTYFSISNYPYPSNGLLVLTKKGIILIDTPWDDIQTEKLLKLCKEKFHKRIILAIITHAHNDRIGGIKTLLKNKIKTISTLKTADAAKTNGFLQPISKLSDDTTLIINKIRVNTFYPGAGHTEDNIVVYFPDSKILYGGCLIKSVEAVDLGNTSEANINEWESTIIKIINKFPEIEIVIPGHGKISNNEALYHTIKLIKAQKNK